jgi:hypothetical protein
MQEGGKCLAVSGDESMFSRPEAAEFFKLYQNFALVDGTHKTNVHDHRLISFSIIDSPGYTFPVGCMMAPSESIESLEVFFNFLNIGDREDYTIMTDEGSAFISYCTALKRTNLLCTYHFQQKALLVCGGMSADVKSQFLKIRLPCFTSHTR